MKKMTALLNYQLDTYIRSGKFAIPVLIFVVLMFFQYMFAPYYIVDSFTLSMVYVFILMVWISFVYQEHEDRVSEQVIILKVEEVGNTHRLHICYYLSRCLFLFHLAGCMSFFAILFPVLIDGVSAGTVFTRALLSVDILCGFLLHWTAGYCGAMLGAAAHPRIIKDKKVRAVLVMLFTVLGLVKTSFPFELPFLMWIFPPIANFLDILMGREYYLFWDVLHAGGLLLTYGAVYMVIQISLLNKNKF